MPDSRISGNQLDPTGEWDKSEVLAKARKTNDSGGGASDPGEAATKDATGRGNTETMRDVDASSGSSAGSSWSSKLSGRGGIVAAAIVVVAIFCALVFAFIYLMMAT